LRFPFGHLGQHGVKQVSTVERLVSFLPEIFYSSGLSKSTRVDCHRNDGSGSGEHSADQRMHEAAEALLKSGTMMRLAAIVAIVRQFAYASC
jgi:hypothetical protein